MNRSNRATWGWDARQCRVLTALVGGLLVMIVWRTAADRTHLENPPQANPDQAPFLADRIDLNTAGLDELVTLPGIGPLRARAIIEYRESAVSPAAFTHPEDLLYVDGFGMTTIEQLQSYLMMKTDRKGESD